MQTVRKRLQDTQIVLKAITHHLGPTIKIKISNKKGSKKKPNLMGIIKTYVLKKTRKTTQTRNRYKLCFGWLHIFDTPGLSKNRVATARNFEIFLRRNS